MPPAEPGGSAELIASSFRWSFQQTIVHQTVRLQRRRRCRVKIYSNKTWQNIYFVKESLNIIKIWCKNVVGSSSSSGTMSQNVGPPVQSTIINLCAKQIFQIDPHLKRKPGYWQITDFIKDCKSAPHCDPDMPLRKTPSRSGQCLRGSKWLHPLRSWAPACLPILRFLHFFVKVHAAGRSVGWLKSKRIINQKGHTVKSSRWSLMKNHQLDYQQFKKPQTKVIPKWRPCLKRRKQELTN